MVVCFVQQAQRDKRSELYTRRYTSQNTATVCLPAYQPGCLSCSCLSLYLTHCLHTWVSLLLQTWLDIIYVIGLLSIGGCYSLARPFQRNTLPLLCLPIPPTTPSLASVDVFKESLSLFILLSTSNQWRPKTLNTELLSCLLQDVIPLTSVICQLWKLQIKSLLQSI